MDKTYITIKVWRKTLKTLRLIHAHTGENMVSILNRLTETELKNLNVKGDSKNNKDD